MNGSTASSRAVAPSRGFRLTGIIVGAASLLSGCYSYLPIAATAPLPGADLRVTFTDAGSLAMTPLLGPRVAAIDGKLERTGSDSVVLRVRTATNMRGEETGWSGERVAIPAAAVANVLQKQLSKSKTAIVAAAGIGVAVAAVVAGGNSGGGEPPTPGGPPPTGQ